MRHDRGADASAVSVHAVGMTTPLPGLTSSYTFPDTPPERRFQRTVEQARAAEAAGLGMVTVMDHVNQIPPNGAQDEPMLEGWSVLAALARETDRVGLGTLVSGVTYRNPALLAKLATTLDDLGRARGPRDRRCRSSRARGLRLRVPASPGADDRLDKASRSCAMFSAGGQLHQAPLPDRGRDQRAATVRRETRDHRRGGGAVT
jgi:hypothetical protein